MSAGRQPYLAHIVEPETGTLRGATIRGVF
ncbi:hypothetical protein THIOKS13320042 [Thiocapsa sp. KS1]|nr:hypothetical protein THIOKS13320042 [Thiocapsa sp. KS1]